MTDEIFDLMEKRRILKHSKQAYEVKQLLIRQIIREAKASYLASQCKEIEALEATYDSFNMYKKIKEATGNSRSNRASGVLCDESGKIVQGLQQKLIEWTNCITELFEDDRIDTEGPQITCRVVEYAIRGSKSRKAVGPDEIPCEVYKLIDDQIGLKVIADFFNKIYSSGKFPIDWLKSAFITITKKSTTKNCDEYRAISLMNHMLKTFLKIIHGRIYAKCEDYLSATQFGFRNGLGTKEALFGINVLAQRSRDISADVYACFIDFQKAFDRVKHEILVDTLKLIELDGADIRVIANLYWRQISIVRVGGSTTPEVTIKRGVRQGCILYPLLFIVYSESIFKGALSEAAVGIVVNVKLINNMRYADDTVLLASSSEDLQRSLNSVVVKCDAAGLELNI
ncbi:hypothetical protein HUJ05_003405 [Dendroctonus ponderosae]|nr:hypothetical protein HUJ05_003405 [Dendroctonus ponderosae]